jgi:16S rRNA (guanine966-N2)-methyltransferase
MGAREKNALFNMIDVVGKRVLDAYAGSGALGIEALSRGAGEVVFVESHRPAVVTIEHNLASLNLTADVFPGKVANCVAEQTGLFDVIIADPPYDKIDFAEITSLPSLLVAGGTLALSSPASQPAPEIAGLVIVSSHTYAEARITIFVKP